MSFLSKLNKSSSRNTSLNLLTNKWVLYIILVLGVFDVFNFYQNGQMISLYVFLFVGILTSFFSKNMIVIIVTAIAIAHIFTYGERMSEGFEEEEEEKEEKEGLEDPEEDLEEDPEKKEKAPVVPSTDSIKVAAEGLAGQIKKTGVEGLSKETFDLISAQETLLKNLGELTSFTKVDGISTKKEGYCDLNTAYGSM